MMRPILSGFFAVILAVSFYLAWLDPAENTKPANIDALAPPPDSIAPSFKSEFRNFPNPVSAAHSTRTDQQNPPPLGRNTILTVGRFPEGARAGSAEWVEALRQLSEQNFAQVFRALWQALESRDPEDVAFQAFILETLEEHSDGAPGEVLAALIRNAPSPGIRCQALQLLAEASQELSVRDFTVAGHDSDPAIRQSGLAFFDEFNTSVLLDATAAAARDPDQAVRLAALSTLEEMTAFAPVWEVAQTLMDDPDPLVRLRALELITYGETQEAISWLVQALQDPDPGISERAEALLNELEQGP